MLRSMIPTLRTSVLARRTFVSSSIARESPLDSVKQAAENLNKAAGDAAAKGIETVESAVNTAADAVKGETNSSLSAEAQKAAAEAKNQGQKVASEAQAAFNKGKIDLDQAAKDNGLKN
ncbi:hypothetical protein JCM16303_001603 [Sporobolomyces ruberrimus]